MVKFRDNYLIAWTQAATQGAGHMEGNRGHIVAERDFGWRGIEEIRQSLSRSQDGGVCLYACGVAPMSICIVI